MAYFWNQLSKKWDVFHTHNILNDDSNNNLSSQISRVEQQLSGEFTRNGGLQVTVQQTSISPRRTNSVSGSSLSSCCLLSDNNHVLFSSWDNNIYGWVGCSLQMLSNHSISCRWQSNHRFDLIELSNFFNCCIWHIANITVTLCLMHDQWARLMHMMMRLLVCLLIKGERQYKLLNCCLSCFFQFLNANLCIFSSVISGCCLGHWTQQ